MLTTIKLKAKDRSCKAFFGFYFGLSFLEDVQQPLPLVRSKSRWYNNIIIRCGRLKSDYRYSNTLVYNNFPWPTTTEQQKLKIEQTAQATLDARALYPDSSLADLYDELTMSPEQRKAHQANDRAVMDAYGFVKGSPARTSESACVAELMKMYQTLTSK